jgi:NADH-quinone oxidoreductase subunit C
MTVEEILAVLQAQFRDQHITGPHPAQDPWLEVPAELWRPCAEFLRDDARLKFDSLTNLCGVDRLNLKPGSSPSEPPHLQLVLHLYSFSHRHRLTLKTRLPRWRDDQPGQLPQIASLATVWPIAEWHEREAYDLMGIEFVGHPNLTRILCPEDWVGHPLRKDYDQPLEYHGIRGR